MAGPSALVEFLRDIRLGVRSLVRAPGLSVPAVSVMALGIAAAAIVFSVMDQVLIRPMAYADPSNVIAIRGTQVDRPGELGTVSYPNVSDVEARSRTIESLAAGSWWNPAFTEAGQAQAVRGLTVSWDYFHVLGLEPATGRFFVEEDEGEGRTPVVVIGHGVWVDRFGGDPGVVGQTVSVNHEAYRVVGVAPRGFEDPIGEAEGWVPQVWRTPWFDAGEWFRSGRSWKAIGRLAPGSEIGRANEELATLMADLARTWPDENQDRGMVAMPVQAWITGGARTTILVLAASVGVILLIACANIANLLLARSLRRADELAVRAALGASGGMIFRTTLAEALALGLVGGAGGVALAYGGMGAMASMASSWIPRIQGATLDGRVVTFAAVMSLTTAVVFGTLPGLWNRRLAQWTRTTTSGTGQSRVRRGLVVLEVASTVVLLFGAGLFVRTFDSLYRVDLGIETERLLTMDLHDSGWIALEPEAASAQWDEVLGRVAELPDVAAVGAIDIVPLGGNRSCDGTARTDLPPPGPGEGQCTEVRTILPGAFDALGITVVRGRAPSRADREDGVRVVWVSEEAERLLWPDGAGGLGGGLRIHGEEFTVAGIVTDVRHFGPEQPPFPMTYLMAHQEPWNGIARGLALVARMRGEVEGLETVVRGAVEQAGPSIPVGPVRTGSELVSGRVSAPRFRVTLTLAFGGIALLIAMVGLAGVISFSVSRRRREIGVRLAVGARGAQIRTMVVREGLGLLWRGLTLGLLIAVPVGVGLGRFLHGVRPWDPVSVVAVCGVMFAGVLLACYPPALRAGRASPVSALRVE